MTPVEDFAAINDHANASELNPLRGWRPTEVQRQYLISRAARFQLRGSNQVGKTEAQAVATLERMLGPDYAYHVPADLCTGGPDWRGWIVCTSWKQSVTIMRKVYALLPKDQLHPGSAFTMRRGFTGQSFQTRNGALLTFVTAKQDDDELASATLDWIGIDEPPPEGKWGELTQRVKQKRGQIGLTYTPINRPVMWLREKVERAEVLDIHAPLCLANVWPLGADRPFQEQDQLDQAMIDCPPAQRAQRIHGRWEGVSLDRYMADFDPDNPEHVHIGRPPDGWSLSVGFDYGFRPGAMAAALVAVKGTRSVRPEIIFWDEVAAEKDEMWDQLKLAEETRKMLERNGLEYKHIDKWAGDRAAQKTRGKRERFSNRTMRNELALAFGRRPTDVRPPSMPPKHLGVEVTCGYINAAFARGRAWVHTRCQGFIHFAAHFNGDAKMEAKDVGDAHRYAFLALWKPSTWSQS